jgi:hypothetical protein
MTHDIGESADERPAACSAAPEMGTPMDIYQCMELTSHQGSTYDEPQHLFVVDEDVDDAHLLTRLPD